MEKRVLFAVDGSQKSLEALSIMGRMLKGQPAYRLVLMHCVQHAAAMYPEDLVKVDEATKLLNIATQEKVGQAVLDASRRALLDSGFPADCLETRLRVDSLDPAQDVLFQAEDSKIRTVAVGRRGRSQIGALLLGSVSSKVAQYGHHLTVWVVDTPVSQTGRVLMAMEGAPDCRELVRYAAEHLAPVPGLRYTLLHVMPPVPPTFWDNGHILGPEEQKDRQGRLEKWRADWTGRVEGLLAEGRETLVTSGVPADHVETRIALTKEGIARDLLNEVADQQYQMVVMGKKSFRERKPFLMGSHANKVLQNVKGVVLVLVDTA